MLRNLCVICVLGVMCTTVTAGEKTAEKTAKKQHKLIELKKTDNESAGFQRTTHPDAQWFENAGLGLFIHWGISSNSPKGNSEISWAMIRNLPWDPKNTGTLTPTEYFKLAEQFDPQNYDPDKWLAAAAKAGFRYAVMTTKHHDGYALWPSEYGEYSTRQYLDGRDLVRPYVEACRKNGLKVGLYYSPPDWYFRRHYMSFNYNSDGN